MLPHQWPRRTWIAIERAFLATCLWVWRGEKMDLVAHDSTT
jgi:hypothetical protein